MAVYVSSMGHPRNIGDLSARKDTMFPRNNQWHGGLNRSYHLQAGSLQTMRYSCRREAQLHKVLVPICAYICSFHMGILIGSPSPETPRHDMPLLLLAQNIQIKLNGIFVSIFRVSNSKAAPNFHPGTQTLCSAPLRLVLACFLDVVKV